MITNERPIARCHRVRFTVRLTSRHEQCFVQFAAAPPAPGLRTPDRGITPAWIITIFTDVGVEIVHYLAHRHLVLAYIVNYSK